MQQHREIIQSEQRNFQGRFESPQKFGLARSEFLNLNPQPTPRLTPSFFCMELWPPQSTETSALL